MEKIIVVAPGSQAAEVGGRLRKTHRVIPLIAHQTSQSILEAVHSHRDAILLYLDTLHLEFKGVRFIWETIEEINRLLGEDRKHMILVITWSEKPPSPSQLVEQSVRMRVNLVAVGKRDSDQVATLISAVFANFVGYLEKYGAIQDSPHTTAKGVRIMTHNTADRPRSGNGHDHAAASGAPNSVFALGGESFTADPPVPTPDEAPEPGEAGPPPLSLDTAPRGQSVAPVVTTPAASPSPPEQQCGEATTPNPIVLSDINLSLLEVAMTEALHAFFRVLRTPQASKDPRSPLIKGGSAPMTVQPVARSHAAPAPQASSSSVPLTENMERFSLVVKNASHPELTDRAPETILVNDVEIATTRRVRRLLEALRSTGRCPMKAAGGTITPGAIQQFLAHVNRSLKPTALKIGVQGEELHLR